MITFTVNIVDSSGKSISVVREYDGELAGRSLSEIESLIFQGKQDTMEASELSLLELNQIEYSKKKERPVKMARHP
ncbi:MAG: hypothetical protein H7Z76_14170 [Methylotenera sp.]|nr:hypothetical protein [Flavobacterium sp.]